MPPDHNASQFRSRAKASLLAAAGVFFFLVIVVPLSVRMYRLRGIPDVGDPFDVADFGTVSVHDDDNALFDYRQAIESLVPMPDGDREFIEHMDDAIEHGWTSATPDIQQWVDDNRLALDRWLEGTNKPDFLIIQPLSLTWSDSELSAPQYRTLARLAALQSSRLVVEGRPEHAWVWTRGLLQYSRHIARHTSMMPRLLAASYYQMGVESTLEIAMSADTSNELLRQMLKESSKIYATTPPESEAFKGEYLSIKNTLRESDHFTDADASAFEKLKVRAGMFVLAEGRLTELVNQHYFANLLDQIDRPVRDRRPRVGEIDAFERDPAKSYSEALLSPEELEQISKRAILFALMAPSFRQLDEACLREQSKAHALEVCLALRIYYVQNGSYPQHVEELVDTNVIDELPLDPYSTSGEPMRYRKLGDEAVVYSIGPNGIDDGGAIDATDNDGLLDIGLKLGDSVEAKKP